MTRHFLNVPLRLLAVGLVMTALFSLRASAQHPALKTNLLYDAAIQTANLGAEVSLAPRWTLDISGNLNTWSTSGDKKWKHWMVQPEARYWLCQNMGGSFFGFHVMGGQYNLGGFNGRYNFLGTDARKLLDTRHQGWFAGAGIAYGYTWMLSRHFNLEAEIGVGYAYTRYDTYPCAKCGTRIDRNKPHNYVGPTKAAVNIEYVF